jgi:flagellar basal-body rod protein FlgG
MSVQLHRQDVHASNLANASTVGYRRSDVAVGSFETALGQAASAGTPQAIGQATVVDVAQGPIHETGTAYDLALDGPGMFTLLTPDGMRHTRDGRFHQDAAGRLLGVSGNQVMGKDGPITLPGGEFFVTEAGQVFSEGQFVDQLFIAEFGVSDELTRTANGLFEIAGGPRLAENTTVRQGCVEEANVSVVREMAQMMVGFRAFEASAAALRLNDQTLSILIEATGS